MRLLEPLTLTTRTLVRATRGGAGLVAHLTKGIAGRVRPSAPRASEGDPATPPASPPRPVRPVAAPAPAPITPSAPVAATTAPDQPEFAPAHIGEEASEVVYSSSDTGAEDGAGPSVHVDEPWHGYRGMTAADVIDRLAVADTAMLAAIQLYETSHKHRPSVLKAVERRLEAAARA